MSTEPDDNEYGDELVPDTSLTGPQARTSTPSITEEEIGEIANRLRLDAILLVRSSQGLVGDAPHWMKDVAANCDRARAALALPSGDGRPASRDTYLTGWNEAREAIKAALDEIKPDGPHTDSYVTGFLVALRAVKRVLETSASTPCASKEQGLSSFPPVDAGVRALEPTGEKDAPG